MLVHLKFQAISLSPISRETAFKIPEVTMLLHLDQILKEESVSIERGFETVMSTKLSLFFAKVKNIDFDGFIDT